MTDFPLLSLLVVVVVVVFHVKRGLSEMKRPSLGTSLRPSTAARTSTMPRRTSSSSTMVRGMSMTTMRAGETMGRTTRPATKAEDRPVLDAQWRKEKAEEVISWLMSHGYDAFVALLSSLLLLLFSPFFYTLVIGRANSSRLTMLRIWLSWI